MQRLKKYAVRILTDAAGYGLIVLSVLTGWLPGPGGIPLFLAGLGLLSIHNAWAKRLLVYVKENGVKFLAIIFPENPWIRALHDLFVLLIFGAVTAILITANNAVAYGVAIVLTFLAIFDILYNRDRWKSLKNKR